MLGGGGGGGVRDESFRVSLMLHERCLQQAGMLTEVMQSTGMRKLKGYLENYAARASVNCVGRVGWKEGRERGRGKSEGERARETRERRGGSIGGLWEGTEQAQA